MNFPVPDRTSGRAFALLVGLVLLALAALPYVSGYSAQTPDERFDGAVFDQQDAAVYWAMMHAGADGDWAYRFRFTSEEQVGAYNRQFYLLLGHLAPKDPDFGDLLAVYMVAQGISGLAMILAVDALMAQLFQDRFSRRLAFVLALTSSGAGWLQVIAGRLPVPEISPIDFWLFDAYPFFALLTFPHFTSVIALLAGMVALFLSDLRRPGPWKALGVAGMGAAAVWIQPFAPLLADLAMAGSLLAVWWKNVRGRGQTVWVATFPRRPAAVLALTIATQLPLVVYNGLVFQIDPAMQAFAAQNITLSPPGVYYLAGFAGLWLCAAIGFLPRGSRPIDPGMVGMAVWIAGALILAYLPWSFQRRFLLAFTVPLAAWAVAGLQRAWQSFARFPALAARKSLFAVLVVAFLGLSSLYLTIGAAAFLQQRPEAYFSPIELVRAVDWLEDHAAPDDVILVDEEAASRLVAGRGGLIVYWGHPIETLSAELKAARAAEFFTGSLDLGWLENEGINWVLFSTFAAWQPDLPLLYQDGDVRVYRVAP